ncbi:MAG TPA: hypothetical protein DD412_08030 [Holosporales bacterium]|nr:hypothetical protein [Holosporales bacterium]
MISIKIPPQFGLKLGQQSKQHSAAPSREIEEELKEQIRTIKRERRTSETYLGFFKFTLSLDEVRSEAEKINQMLEKEAGLKETYKKLKREGKKENSLKIKESVH